MPLFMILRIAVILAKQNRLKCAWRDTWIYSAFKKPTSFSSYFSGNSFCLWNTLSRTFTFNSFTLFKNYFYQLLAEGPGVARGKKNFEKKNFEFFLAYNTPRSPLSVHKIFQPNRSSRLAGYREHIYECLVLLFRYILFTRVKLGLIIIRMKIISEANNCYRHFV